MGVPGKRIDDVTRLTVLRLLKQGYSHRQIVRLVGIAKRSVAKIRRELRAL
jgi:transposase-like protein